MRKSAKVQIQKLHPNAKVPGYAYTGDAGFDFSCIEDFRVIPGRFTVVNTGIAMAIPFGYEVQVRSRSGLAFNQGIQVYNSPGTLDSAYRGEVKILLFNAGPEIRYFKAGDRIAQGVLQEVPYAEFEVVEALDDTQRGDKGLGSSGT